MTDGWERRPGTLPMSTRRPWPTRLLQSGGRAGPIQLIARAAHLMTSAK
jgi:hypothetical protein